MKTRTRERGRNRGKEIKKEIKIIFWNIAGLIKKGRDFWEYVESFDIIGLWETCGRGKRMGECK